MSRTSYGFSDYPRAYEGYAVGGYAGNAPVYNSYGYEFRTKGKVRLEAILVPLYELVENYMGRTPLGMRLENNIIGTGLEMGLISQEEFNEAEKLIEQAWKLCIFPKFY